MARVKRWKAAHKKKKKFLKQTKGFRWGRKSKYRAAKEAMLHAGTHSFVDRKKKKRNFRGLWQIQIAAFCKQNNLSYSRFICELKKNKIEIDRKIMAQLGQKYPKIMEKIIKSCSTK